MTTTSLDGVRVLDLSRFPPGQYCTLLLADQGAQVFRVEKPGSVPLMSGVGVGLSRGKKSIALDLSHREGYQVLRRLAGSVDVLVENFSPGYMEERGFGYRQAADELPSLVWCSITGFGQDGPYAQRPGHDITYTAYSGLMAALLPDLPWQPQFTLAIPLGGMMAASAVASALYERERTGAGGHIDISMSEAATWVLSGSDGEINGDPWGVPFGPERNLYECSDGCFVTVAANESRVWQALMEGLGLEDLAEQGPYAGDRDAVQNRIAEAFATAPAAEWVSRLGPGGTSVAAVNFGTDLPHDPHVQQRGGLLDIEGTLVPASPIRRRDAAGPVRAPEPTSSPEVGADTREVLEMAGYTAAEIDAMLAAGVVAAGDAGVERT